MACPADAPLVATEVRAPRRLVAIAGSAALPTAVFLLATASVATLWPTTARAAECPRAPSVEVTTSRIHDPIAQDMSVGVDTMLRLAGPARAARHYPLLGMSKSTLSYAVSTRIRSVPAGDGAVCPVAESVTLTIGYTARTVYVAREAASDACLLRENLRHQLAHAHSDDAALEEFLPTLVGELQDAVKRLPLKPEATEVAARAELNGGIAKALSKAIDSYEKFHEGRRRAIDAPARLEALAKSCAGRGAAIVDRGPSI